MTEKSSEQEAKPRSTQRILTSAVLYIHYFGLAWTQGVFGPCLLHLAALLGTDIKTLGSIFGGSKAGYMVGALINGPLIDRINRNLLMSPVSLVLGVMVVVIPWTRHLAVFAICFLVLNFCIGFLNSGTQATMLNLWRGTASAGPTYQALHGIWGIGAAIVPIVIAPFLIPLKREPMCDVTHALNQSDTVTRALNQSDTSVSCVVEEVNITSLDGPSVNSTAEDHNDDIGIIVYGFLITSTLLFVTGILFIVQFCRTKPKEILQRKIRTSREVEEISQSRCLRTFIICCGISLVFFDMWLEEISQIYLTAIAVRGFNWPVKHGSWLTSVFFGSLCFGRILGIPLSRVVKPDKLLLGSLLLTLLSYVLMVNADRMGDAVLWLTAGMSGLCLSTTFAAAVDLVNRKTQVSGVVMSFIMLGSASGAAVSSILAGYLFQTYSYKYPIYMCILACLLDLAILTVLLVVLKVTTRRQLAVRADEKVAELTIPMTSTEKNDTV